MGNNELWTVMEDTVIRVADTGRLSIRVLDAIMEPYRGTDIDSGGHRDRRTQKGMDLYDVVFDVMNKSNQRWKPPVYPNLPPKGASLEAQEAFSDDVDEARHVAFGRVTNERWGW